LGAIFTLDKSAHGLAFRGKVRLYPVGSFHTPSADCCYKRL
jgi:hypothetical protein